MSTSSRIAAACLAAGAAGLLQAADSETYELKPDLVVTPSRVAEPLDQSLAAATVITRDDIERSAALDLLALLRLQPGLDIVRSGGAGAQTSIFLRGGNSNHLLVLIDGVRVSSANTGAYAWEQLPLNQVERIEIVRGPRGSQYGSDSIGGVIQVFTRGNPDPYAHVTGGSYGTVAFDGGLGYRGPRSRLSVNAGYRDVDGFSAQNPRGFSYDPDDDGFRTVNLGVKGSADAASGSWHYSLLALDTESEFDQGESDARQAIASVAYRGGFTANWDYQLQIGYVHDELFTDFLFFTTDFDSRRAQITWQNQLHLSAGRLDFGAEYYREHGTSAASWDESRGNAGLYATYDRRLGGLQLQLGGRLDDNSRFGNRFTGQVALGYDFGQHWQLSGSYGSAFRGPNLSEQFSPGFGGYFAGNPDLDPESSVAAEVILRWRHVTGGRLSASLYRSDVDDMIAFNGEFFQAVNIDRARLEGLELEYGLERGGWLLNANLSIQHSEDRASGEALLRRPDEKGSISLDRQFGNGSWLGLEWFYSGDRMDFGGIVLDSYSLLNLRAGWSLAPAWRLELRGDNLAGEDYEPAWGFDAAGRSWYLSLNWAP